MSCKTRCLVKRKMIHLQTIFSVVHRLFGKTINNKEKTNKQKKGPPADNIFCCVRIVWQNHGLFHPLPMLPIRKASWQCLFLSCFQCHPNVIPWKHLSCFKDNLVQERCPQTQDLQCLLQRPSPHSPQLEIFQRCCRRSPPRRGWTMYSCARVCYFIRIQCHAREGPRSSLNWSQFEDLAQGPV